MILFFKGEAGTGKTYQLISATTKFVMDNALLPYQRILALTFMHGSRKRLKQRLSDEESLSKIFECVTIDSFAYKLILRWRSFFLVDSKDLSFSDLSFDEICSKAVEILKESEVRNWLKRKYPLIIIDEMQDCRNSRLELIKNLSKTITIYAAADSFQDLATEDDSNEATEWLSSNAEVKQLNIVHRTNVSNIINLAQNIRNSGRINQRATNAYISRCYNIKGAATSIDRSLFFSFKTSANHVILSPTKPESSKFISSTLNIITNERLSISICKEPERRREVGPFSFVFEKAEVDLCNTIKESLNISEDIAEYNLENFFQQSLSGIYKLLQSWIKKKHRLLGQRVFSYDEVNNAISRIVHLYQSHYKKDSAKYVFMTIHQAKNREFDHVIVLWPYEVQGSAVKQRKLFYNAVTRAKKRVDIIVLDPKETRLSSPPFV